MLKKQVEIRNLFHLWVFYMVFQDELVLQRTSVHQSWIEVCFGIGLVLGSQQGSRVQVGLRVLRNGDAWGVHLIMLPPGFQILLI